MASRLYAALLAVVAREGIGAQLSPYQKSRRLTTPSNSGVADQAGPLDAALRRARFGRGRAWQRAYLGRGEEVRCCQSVDEVSDPQKKSQHPVRERRPPKNRGRQRSDRARAGAALS
jgi:hypothetical protein